MEQSCGTPSQHLAAKIRELRTGLAWSTRQAAERCTAAGCHLTRGTLAKIECGARPIVTFDEAVAFARAFGVSLDSLAPPPPDDVGVCPRCGVAPVDAWLHRRWHREEFEEES